MGKITINLSIARSGDFKYLESGARHSYIEVAVSQVWPVDGQYST